MAGRNATSVSVRLKRLYSARDRVWKTERGAILRGPEMAKLLGVSWATLREWTNEIETFEQSGAFERGGNGMQYEFCPVRTLWFLIDHYDALAGQQAGRNQVMQESTGLDLPETESDVSFEEAKGLVNLTVTVVSAAREQGKYTPTGEWTGFLEGYNGRVVSGILGVGTKVDPNGMLPPAVRADMDRYLRELATSVHDDAVSFIGEYREGLQQAGTG